MTTNALNISRDSSIIAAASYDSATRNLTVTLRTRQDRPYRFFGVPHNVVAAFERAASAGRFFNREIRPHYPVSDAS